MINTTQYRVKRVDRASFTKDPLAIGQIIFDGIDGTGCASEDGRHFGIEYATCSVNESGLPFFTIPTLDIEKIEASE